MSVTVTCEACGYGVGNWWHLWGCQNLPTPTVIRTDEGPKRVNPDGPGV